jgi:nitrate/nitrite transporter NarK
MTNPSIAPRNLWRSTGAVLVGFFACALLSIGTDVILHLLKIYPPADQPMWDPGLNFLALAYRCVYAVIGGYLTAKLAPRNPMRHVWVLAFIGLAMAVAGVIATSGMNLGPRWYPIALAVTALPTVWLGGVLHRRQSLKAEG